MKVGLLFLLVIQSLISNGQSEDVEAINKIIKGYKPHKQLLLRFEKVDSVHYGEQPLTVNRSYLLDPVVRQLSKITVFENQSNPKMGLQIIYAFANDQLVKITYTPSTNVCMRCQAEYYFKDKMLFHKEERGVTGSDIAELFKDAQTLKTKAPKPLPCGHYEVENCIHVRNKY